MKTKPVTALSRRCVVSLPLLFAGKPMWSAENSSSNVPMTRIGERLAVHDNMGSSATFAELDADTLLISHPLTFAASKDGGLTWSKPWKGVGLEDQAIGEASMVKLDKKGLGYIFRRNYDFEGRPTSGLFFSRSDDGAKTWSAPTRIHPAFPFGVAMLNDVVVRASSGRLILPVYGFMRLPGDSLSRGKVMMAMHRNKWVPVGAHDWDPKFTWCYAYFSDDEGHTWRSSHSGEMVIWDSQNMMWGRTNEPSAAEVTPGKVVMVMRTEMGRPYISWSKDNGETWSAPEAMPLASSASPAQIRRIPGTGDLLMIWNQASEGDIKNGLIRSRLSTAVSRTGGTQGRIWEFYQNIASIQEGTRVEIGPLRRVRPEGLFHENPLIADESARIPQLPDNYAMTSYPSACFHKDRLIVGHSWAHFDSDFKYVNPGKVEVVPISWLYGGPQGMKPDGFTPWRNRRYPIQP